jgi:hypothetical protein
MIFVSSIADFNESDLVPSGIPIKLLLPTSVVQRAAPRWAGSGVTILAVVAAATPSTTDADQPHQCDNEVDQQWFLPSKTAVQVRIRLNES